MRLGALENTGTQYRNAVNKDKAGGETFVQGQILEGVVTDAKEQVTIDFSGKKLNFPRESVPDAQKGQVRRFQVMKADSTGIALKEIGRKEQPQAGRAIFTQVDSGQYLVASEGNVPEEEESENPEDVARRMTEEDYAALEEEGYTLEKYTMGQLERALERIKADRELKSENVENMQKKQAAKREEIRKMAVHVFKDRPGVAEYLADLLIKADIPVTKEKIENILEASKKAAAAIGSTGLSSSAKAYLIGNELSPEIDSLYKAVHSGNGKEQNIPDPVWEQLAPSAARVLAEAGRPADEKGMADAKWLLEHELPLTAENLAYKAELDALPDNAGLEQILEKAVQAVKEGKSAGSALLARSPQTLAAAAKAEAYRRDFESILPETVNEAVRRLQDKGAKQELSLSFLLRLQQELGSKEGGVSIQDVTARRQLEEIRLKLTVESGAKLLSQGIKLDTDGLGRIVEGLREIEREYYRRLYQEAGGKITEETAGQIELLERTRETVENLKSAPAYVLGVTFRNRMQETLPEMQEAASRIAEGFKRAEESYEALMTKPRADMGDSIQKAFRNVDSLLKGMDMELTEANRRAVRILSYNNMELSRDNLENMKLYDAQVNTLLKNMNPAACAMLIKKGINPLDMPVLKLNEVLTRLRDEEGATTEEKYSAYLVKLDQKKELSAEQRESYIGIYRLLYQVAKTDGAALGAVVGSGRDITLSSLLSAVRTRKKGGMDTSVNDEFGAAEEINQSNASISDQIGAAFRYQQTKGMAEDTADLRSQQTLAQQMEGMAEDAVNFRYQQTLAQQILEEVTPEKLMQAEERSKQPVEKMSLEQLKEAMQQADAREEALDYAKTKVESFDAAAENIPARLFLEEFGIETSIAALQAAKELLSSQSSIKSSIKNLAEKYKMEVPEEEIDIDAMENAEKMQNMVEKWADSADKSIDSLFADSALTGEDSMRLLTLRSTVQLSKRVAKREFYEIPLRHESGFVKLNLTVVHSGENKGAAVIRMKGEEEVTFEIRMEGKGVNCYTSTASRPELERLTQQEETIKQSLTEQGFEITQWNYGLKTRSAGSESSQGISVLRAEKQDQTPEPELTRTDDLYLVAKTIIKAAGFVE